MSPDAGQSASQLPRYIGVGCFMAIAGFFSGAMIGVLAGKFVGMATRCIPDPGLPVCNWHLFAGAGGLLGAISLPILVVWRLRQSVPSPEHSERG